MAGDTLDKQIEHFLSGLEPVIRQARDEQAKADRQDATRFSVFGYFLDRETAISRIIADLLDPQGSHGQGAAFLRLFGRHCMQGLAVQPPVGPAQCRVGLEEATARGRRVDIVVRFPGGVIGIENKPWTIDQRDQLTDYIGHFSGEDWVMLYLSGSGAAPSEDSISKEDRDEYEKNDRFRVIPFCTPEAGGDSLEKWLDSCFRACEAERVRWFLKDVLTYIRREFASHETEPSREVSMTADHIIKRPDLFGTALMVEEAMPAVREGLIGMFLDDLEGRLRQGEWRVDTSYDAPESLQKDVMDNYAWLLLRKDRWSKEKGIAISTDAPEWGKVSLGVWCAGEIQTEVRQKTEGYFGSHPKPTRAWATWKWLNCRGGDLSWNWRGTTFLKRVADETERREMVKSLAGEMMELAKAVEGIFDGETA